MLYELLYTDLEFSADLFTSAGGYRRRVLCSCVWTEWFLLYTVCDCACMLVCAPVR